MDARQILFHPFTLGLALGFVFTALALYQLFRARGEMKHYKRHLSDKLEIEAESMQKMRRDTESLRKENETLRMKVSAVNETASGRVGRDLEVFARAEKRMLVSVPGFAPAWESAKSTAIAELEDEEAGRSLPKRVFSKLFGSRADLDKSTEEAPFTHALPDSESRGSK